MGGDTLGKTLQSPLTSHTRQQIIVTLENQSLTPDISFIVCLLFFSFQDFTFQDTTGISGSIFMHFFTLG